MRSQEPAGVSPRGCQVDCSGCGNFSVSVLRAPVLLLGPLSFSQGHANLSARKSGDETVSIESWWKKERVLSRWTRVINWEWGRSGCGFCEIQTTIEGSVMINGIYLCFRPRAYTASIFWSDGCPFRSLNLSLPLFDSLSFRKSKAWFTYYRDHRFSRSSLRVGSVVWRQLSCDEFSGDPQQLHGERGPHCEWREARVHGAESDAGYSLQVRSVGVQLTRPRKSGSCIRKNEWSRYDKKAPECVYIASRKKTRSSRRICGPRTYPPHVRVGLGLGLASRKG